MTGTYNPKKEKNTVTALISHFFQILKMLLCTMYPETDLSIVQSTLHVHDTAYFVHICTNIRLQNKFQKSTTYSKMHVDKTVLISLKKNRNNL